MGPGNHIGPFGFIVLQADETLEQDMRRLMPPDMPYLVSRVPSSPTLTRESLREMEGHLTTAASLFPLMTATFSTLLKIADFFCDEFIRNFRNKGLYFII